MDKKQLALQLLREYLKYRVINPMKETGMSSREIIDTYNEIYQGLKVGDEDAESRALRRKKIELEKEIRAMYQRLKAYGEERKEENKNKNMKGPD